MIQDRDMADEGAIDAFKGPWVRRDEVVAKLLQIGESVVSEDGATICVGKGSEEVT